MERFKVGSSKMVVPSKFNNRVLDVVVTASPLPWTNHHTGSFDLSVWVQIPGPIDSSFSCITSMPDASGNPAWFGEVRSVRTPDHILAMPMSSSRLEAFDLWHEELTLALHQVIERLLTKFGISASDINPKVDGRAEVAWWPGHSSTFISTTPTTPTTR